MRAGSEGGRRCFRQRLAAGSQGRRWGRSGMAAAARKQQHVWPCWQLLSSERVPANRRR
jgi:hypothetical protein